MSNSTSTPKVSFTIRRPTPVSRAASSGAESDSSSFKVPSLPRHLTNSNDSTPGSPLARSTNSSPKPPKHSDRRPYYNEEPDSSDEDDNELQDELVTGFDRFGVQRLKPKKAPQGPLVIPALQNRDWREMARKRKSATQYVPASAKAETGKDGSVGGLGVRDTINSGPVLVGLQVKKDHDHTMKQEDEDMEGIEQEGGGTIKKEEDEETEDQKALRAILAGTDANEGPLIDIIPITAPVSETDAYKQDVEDLPDAATLEDYNRVPVSQFGAALLRGMGWKEGTAASRKKGKGLVEPYLPEARPALLGIGAKEREVLDDGSTKKGRGGANKRPERRYVPVIKKEREGNGALVRTRDGEETPGSGSSSSARDKDRRRHRSRSRSPRRAPGTTSVSQSRRSSRSPERKDKDRSDRDRDHDDRRKDGGRRGYERDGDRRRDDSDRHRDIERRRDRSPDRKRRY